MISENLNGKRLLLVGGIGPTADLITLAHRNDVFLGVADYNKDTSVKRRADAAYEINALDVDAIVDLCKREHYDGVISNFNDLVSPYVAQAAERLGFYSPFTTEQLRMSTDKKYFKDTCIRYGVPVPKEYKLQSIESIGQENIEYPVIVKPVDGSGSKGIHVCEDEGQLREGLASAKLSSRSGRVIVEQYLPYDEINVTYIIQEGDIQLAAIHDRYFNTTQKGVIQVPDMYIYPSRYVDVYIQKYNDVVIQMLKGIGLRNGSLFLQACVKDNQVYFYEAGMRLNGCKTYQILEVENDYNTFEHLMQYALTGSMGKYCHFDARFKRWYATWCVVANPGMTCDAFSGRELLNSYPWLIHIAEAYSKGEKIPDTAMGTLIQLVARIHIQGDTKEQLFERIEKMYQLYQIYDKERKKVLQTPHSVDDLMAKIDYELSTTKTK